MALVVSTVIIQKTMNLDPDKLIGKHIAWNAPDGRTAHGDVRALSARPDMVYAETSYGKKRTVSKVLLKDIVKVYE